MTVCVVSSSRTRTVMSCSLVALDRRYATHAHQWTDADRPKSSNAAEQIVGRERRERVSPLASRGGRCFDSRRHVNSTVGRLLYATKGGMMPVQFKNDIDVGHVLTLIALTAGFIWWVYTTQREWRKKIKD